MRRTRIQRCRPHIHPIATDEQTSSIGRFVPGPEVGPARSRYFKKDALKPGRPFQSFQIVRTHGASA